MIDDFVTTMSTAENLESNDLVGAIIVLVLYGTLWSFGLVAVGFFAWARYHSESKKKLHALQNKSPRSCEVHEYLLSYGTTLDTHLAFLPSFLPHSR